MGEVTVAEERDQLATVSNEVRGANLTLNNDLTLRSESPVWQCRTMSTDKWATSKSTQLSTNIWVKLLMLLKNSILN